MQPFLLLAVTALLAQGDAPPRTSYAQAHARVFANPFATPQTDMFSAVPELGLAFSGRGVLGAFGRIVSSNVDFREDTQKVVHRWGVCAEATWDMDGESDHPFGGLFTPGTRVPAILRMATGTNRTVHFAMAARTWGVALKLFPSQDPQEPVTTVNLSLFDQHGLDGQARPYFLQPLPSQQPLFFSNLIKAEALQSRIAGFVLGRFDRTPLFRSLRPLAAVDESGAVPFNTLSPSVVQLHVRHSVHQVGTLPEDYRQELLAYAPGELVFDVVLPAQANQPAVRRIGTVTVGRMVMSPVCDGALHFAHPPTPLDEVVP